MWVLINNYDSFTHILADYLNQVNNNCIIVNNDAVSIRELEALKPGRIILSPGPQTPHEAGITLQVIEHFHRSTPILGICLGHQALGIFFGQELIHAPSPMHGKTSLVRHNKHAIFKNIPGEFQAMRYHSLCIKDKESSPYESIAYSCDDNTIMASAHKEYPCIGLQFHPESIGTPSGLEIIKNWAGLYQQY